MITNHMQEVWEDDGIIYCHLLQRLAPFSTEHFNLNCRNCTYFAGTLQGNGIECKFESPLGTAFERINNPLELMIELDEKGYLKREETDESSGT